VRVERTIDTARRQSPVLKTGRVTGPPSLPLWLNEYSAFLLKLWKTTFLYGFLENSNRSFGVAMLRDVLRR